MISSHSSSLCTDDSSLSLTAHEYLVLGPLKDVHADGCLAPTTTVATATATATAGRVHPLSKLFEACAVQRL